MSGQNQRFESIACVDVMPHDQEKQSTKRRSMMLSKVHEV